VRPHLPALTGLRFVAALYVVVYHALRSTLVDDPSAPAQFLAQGPVAVSVFFVLSGFVLTWAYGESGVVLARRPFVVARLARLVPVYLLSLLLVVPIGLVARTRGLVDDPLGPLSLLLVSTGLQAFVPQAALRWNPPAWSLSCELFFYALFPWLLGALRRASSRTLAVATALSWCAGVAITVTYLVVDPDHLGVPRIVDEATWLHVVKFHPFVRLPEFFMGVVAGCLFLRGVRVPAAGGFGSIALAVLLPMLLPWPSFFWHNGVLSPLFAAMVLWLADGSNQSLLARTLSSTVFLRLGQASYALYLLHVPVLMWCMAILRVRELSPAPALAACALCIPLSVVVERVVERPLRAWLTDRLSKDDPRQSVGEAPGVAAQAAVHRPGGEQKSDVTPP
jgi:peptidoglycan/LPS O-acetylase OafA/YrhL